MMIFFDSEGGFNMSLVRLIFGISLCLNSTVRVFAAEPTPFRVVGYLPDYRAAEFDISNARNLTDLIVFSASPSPEGILELGRLKEMVAWDKLRSFKTRERVRLILCVGGWERSKNFPEIAVDPARRKVFVSSAVQLCIAERLDGLDLDWEHPQSQDQQNAYGQLLRELQTAFQPQGLVLSVTIAAWQKLPRDAFDAVDTVNIMAYDDSGRHSTYESAQASIKTLVDQGVPAQKIILGLPFYARHIMKRDQAMTYREILAKYKLSKNVDEIDGFYFNGPVTIRRKTKLAIDSQLGGVMVWELGQDAVGEQSLLRVIHSTIPQTRK